MLAITPGLVQQPGGAVTLNSGDEMEIEITDKVAKSDVDFLSLGLDDFNRNFETEAKNHQVLGIHLARFSFQALRFFRRNEYRIFGEIKDHPIGHQRYFLKKTIKYTS